MAKQWFGIDNRGMILMKRYDPRAYALERTSGKRITGPIPAANIQEARDKAKVILRKDQPKYHGL